MARRGYVDYKTILEDYGEQAVEAMRKEMEAMADEIVADMKSRVPVDTGALRDSIHWKWNKKHTAIEIIADAKNPKTGFMYGRIVEFSPKINEPFFYPAMDAHRDEYRERLMAALRRVIKEGGKG